MKKKNRKLRLSTETLKPLAGSDGIEQAVGGSYYYSCGSACNSQCSCFYTGCNASYCNSRCSCFYTGCNC